MTTTREKVDVYEIVTEKVLAALESGTVPWHQPWSADYGLPKSLSTGKAYRGINIFLLGMSAMVGEFESPFWGTYKKITEKGGQVRKGEKGTLITFWKRFKVTDKETGEEKYIPVLRYYNVFNADQADWPEGKKPQAPKNEASTVERHEAAEAIVKGYPDAPKIRFYGDAAFYVPATDVVTLPQRDSFDSTEAFYAAAFHELTHSTGAAQRLHRPGVTEFDHFGSGKYGKEELVAEFGSALLSGIAGLDQTTTIENSGAYLRHWLGVLKDDHKLVVQAAAQAQHAADHILGVTFGEEKDSD